MKPDDIMGTFFSFNNPAIFVIVFMVILVTVIAVIKKEFIIPLKKKIRELEKENDLLRKGIGKYK